MPVKSTVQQIWGSHGRAIRKNNAEILTANKRNCELQLSWCGEMTGK